MSERFLCYIGYATLGCSVCPVFDCVLMRTQELQEAERAFVDVCDQIAKAERFFPVPGASASSGTSMPPRGMPSGALSSWGSAMLLQELSSVQAHHQSKWGRHSLGRNTTQNKVLCSWSCLLFV